MEASLSHLASHFRGQDRTSNAEAARREHWFIKAKDDKKRKEAASEQADGDLVDLSATTAMATTTQIERFEARLDALDAATIEALDENRLRLEDVQRLLEAADLDIRWMLEQAHVMDDGRRVFLTRDRSQAFDEFGAEVFESELDFDLVGETAPSYEDYAEKVELRDELQEKFDTLRTERQTILDFQDRLDEVREQTSDGDVAEAELEALDAELNALMPPSVERRLPESERPELPTPALDQPTASTVPNFQNTTLNQFTP